MIVELDQNSEYINESKNQEIESVNDENELNSELNELETIPMEFVDTRLDNAEYVRNLLEAVLLMSPEPVELKRITKPFGIKRALVEKALSMLIEDYKSRGIIIKQVGDGLEFGTSPDLAEHLEKFYQLERKRRISRAALQTLSIIAYNQPVTRAEIESFRGGVNSDGVIQSLFERNLVKIAGRKETPGNPYLYSVSDDFLKYFGLKSVDELKDRLPAIEDEIAKDGGITQLKLKDIGIIPGEDSDEVPGESYDSESGLDSDSLISDDYSDIETDDLNTGLETL